MTEKKHCDAYIRDKTQPQCLRAFLLFHRIPAMWRAKWMDRGWPVPILFATQKAYRGIGGGYKRPRLVRVVMASRFGDVGITPDLDAERGYDARVMIEDLEGFHIL